MKKALIDIVFWLHFIIVFLWISLFFLLENFWPEKKSFYFYITLIIFGHQVLWGILIMPWTKKFRLVCILTTLMQSLRGIKISDSKNYEHHFTVEFLNKLGINIKYNVLAILGATIFAFITIEYLFF